MIYNKQTAFRNMQNTDLSITAPQKGMRVDGRWTYVKGDLKNNKKFL